MVTKGIIQSIDYLGNTCTVHIPLFENAANVQQNIVEATFTNTPGIYNGYKENDIVWVAFEDGRFEAPVVIGKLYLGASEEQKEGRGAINCDSFAATSNLSIPITTKLVFNGGGQGDTTVDTDTSLSTYKTIADIARGIQKQETKLGTISNQIIDDGENLGARLTRVEHENATQQTDIIANADGLAVETTRRKESDDALSSRITTTESNINATVVHKKENIDEPTQENGLG